jgi:hypothetical protein
VGGNIRRTFRTSIGSAVSKLESPIDWVEWRADEFMGAFLVPADRLAHVLPRYASALELPFRWRAAQTLPINKSGRPLPFVDLDPSEDLLGLLVDDLTEPSVSPRPSCRLGLPRAALLAAHSKQRG